VCAALSYSVCRSSMLNSAVCEEPKLSSRSFAAGVVAFVDAAVWAGAVVVLL
jgi:hypothetical protein